MSKQAHKTHNSKQEEINFIENKDHCEDLIKIINYQVKKTHTSNINLLQQIKEGLYLLTIKKAVEITSMEVKKLSDRAQYAILPTQNDSEAFGKLSLHSIKNQCYGLTHTAWSLALIDQENLTTCHLYFYFNLKYVENNFAKKLASSEIYSKEMLSNRIAIVSDGTYNYPLAIAKLPACAIWRNNSLTSTIDHEIATLRSKFQLCKELFSSLKNSYKSSEWTLTDGQMRYTYKGVTRSLDYANLLDDIIYAHYENRMEEYLAHFHISVLDTSSSFPTVSVRSPIHLKARPQSLSHIENGYVIVAAKEDFGAQSTIDIPDENSRQSFSLWLNRSLRHLCRHNYKARVIFSSEQTKSAISLVGEQIATIAIFPPLVKGVFEALNLKAPKSVRVIAHNEDVITIAHDTASWVDINAVNEKATSLFRLVAQDGKDPLSLFEQIVLPSVGVGSFHLKTVPPAFFELLSTANSINNAMPPGHNHYLLALAYECLYEWGLAAAEFQKALRFDSNDPDILHGLGCSLREIGRIEESLPFLKRASDVMPEDPEIANNWGRSSMECGQLSDAIKAFERAVRLSPGSADYLKNLGDGYLLAARPTDALNMLNKAVRCDPHFAEAHASLATLHLAVGDENQAKKHALMAYKENPVDANIANLLWRLTLGKK